MLKIVSKKRIKVLGMLVFGVAIVSSTHSLAAATAAVGTALQHSSAASESSSNSETQRQNPAKDGGLPGVVLRAHFAALKARDWNALKAVTAGEIREMMDEDEANIYSLLLSLLPVWMGAIQADGSSSPNVLVGDPACTCAKYS